MATIAGLDERDDLVEDTTLEARVTTREANCE
jgi:hypothetical protein